jgi:hypothetical protein
MTTESTFRTTGGPPTLNEDGDTIFKIKPIIKNGNVSSPILSPLPTSTFSLIFSPLVLLLLDLPALPINAASLSIGDYRKSGQSFP